MTAEQEHYIKKYLNRISKKALAKHLGISLKRLNENIEDLGLVHNKKKKWTVLDDTFIRENQYLSDDKLAQILGRSESAVKSRRSFLFCTEEWNEEDIKYLVKNYGIVSKIKICKKLNKTRNSVDKKISELGIKYNSSFTASRERFTGWLWKKAKDKTPREVKMLLEDLDLPKGVTVDNLMSYYWEWREEYANNKNCF